MDLILEGGAPENFHISFGPDDDDSNLSGTSMRCPLCCYSRRHFHCKNCLRNGDFLHSSHHLLERFSEKQLRYKNLKAAHATLESKCVQLLTRRRLACQLRAEIKQKAENIQNIRKLMALRLGNVGRLQDLKKELHESNRSLRIKLPQCDKKVRIMGDYVLSKFDESERRRECLTEMQEKLRQLKRDHIDKLVKFIFPISQAISNRSSFSSSDGESKNTINEISEATRTAYVRGKWILQDSFGEIQHIIVAPALPGNGNYSAYNDWATVTPATDVSVVGGTKSGEDATKNVASRNPAHTIAAALTYTSQLVQIMCFYLDIRLPYKVSYSDFCTTALSEAQFNRKVARLNANILYLCYTQGCRLNELRPTHTLENLQKLMNPSHASLGPMDRNFCLNELADSTLTQNLGVGEDSDSDDESNLQQEWEAVPSNLPPSHSGEPTLSPGGTTILLPPYNHYHQTQQHPAAVATAATQSLMTSAVASVTSFWKGWTGK